MAQVKKALAKKEVTEEVEATVKKTKKTEEVQVPEKLVDKDPEKKKGFVGNLRKFFKREQ